MLRVKYSSGSRNQATFSGLNRDSRGGLMTGTEVPDNEANIFSTVSQRMLSDGIDEFRLLYLHNTYNAQISNLKIWSDVPLVASVKDPANLSPSPSNGDKYVVPQDAQGDWEGHDGEQAEWDAISSSWTFTFADFAEFAYGYVDPAYVDVKSLQDCGSAETLPFVKPLENIFDQPAVSFTVANGKNQADTPGNGTIEADKALGLWVRRRVFPYSFSADDLRLDEGGVVHDETIPINFEFDV